MLHYKRLLEVFVEGAAIVNNICSWEKHRNTQRSIVVTMKVVRVVGYHQNLQLDEAPEPKISSPLDVIVKVNAAGVCR